jgi:hypothetical protein
VGAKAPKAADKDHPFSTLISEITDTNPDVEGIIAGAKQNSLNKDTYRGQDLEPFAGRLLQELELEQNPHMRVKFLAQVLRDFGA